MRSPRTGTVILVLIASMTLTTCDNPVLFQAIRGADDASGSGSSQPTDPEPVNMWTWMGGSSTGGTAGVYGEKGVAHPDNQPGARIPAATWTDGNGDFWMFGGGGHDADGNTGLLNDLWRFDGDVWTWESGSTTADQTGVYTGAPEDLVPGGRSLSVSWTGVDGSLWLFGGSGFSASAEGYLNDLWRYDGTHWTWETGSDQTDSNGSPGVIGDPSHSYSPAARAGAASWRGADGSFWMFGGDGTPKPTGLHTDLWRVNEQGWARMAGPFGKAQPGIYGTKGEAAEDNRPGARFWAASWTDEAGKLWLFGGSGLDSNDIRGTLNDLWMFDGTHWTWMAGNKTVSGQGQYGEAGVPSPSNYPGSRSQSTVWKTGNTVWLFGGSGYGSSNAHGRLNDLWRLDGSTWTFIGGSDQVSATGVYGTTGVNDPPSQPGSRVGAASWVDGDGRLWMFGGYGADEDELHTYLGDLWKFEL